jgi:pectate lyase
MYMRFRRNVVSYRYDKTPRRELGLMFLLVLAGLCVMMPVLSCQHTNTVYNTEYSADSQIGIIISLAGQRVTTNGWADMANSGSGLSYANPASVLVIDDDIYPSPSAKRKAFTDAVKTDAQRFIIISGDIDLSDGKISDKDKSYFDQFNSDGTRTHGDIVFPVGSNTTIFGLNNARIMFGGMQIKDKSNIIIRNITFYDAHGSTEKDTSKDSGSKASIDALVVEGNSDGIWVDHCTFTDGTCSDLIRNINHDGAFDIKQGKNITVSYCEFTNHDKVMLIAPGDTYTTPEERQITLHHTYFHGTTQRMPRSRGCQMHIYNNYYTTIGVDGNGGYSLGPGIGSQYIVENNCFGSHKAKILKYFDKSAASEDSTFSRFYHAGNSPELTAGNCSYDSVDALKDFNIHVSSSKPWTIPYSYTLETASGLNSSLPKKAGSGKTAAADGSLK